MLRCIATLGPRPFRPVGLGLILFTLVVSCARPARLLWAPPTAEAKRVEFSILEDYDKGDDLADVAKDFDLFHELGITTWRGSFGWDDYEPSRGVYDFDWLHRFADLAEQRGITLRPYIGYTPQWAAAGGRDAEAWNDPPRDVEDWYRFVRALAAAMRRHRNVVSFEIYNEENAAQWWDGTPGEYRNVLQRAADAMRQANRRLQVLFGGMVYADVQWLQEICRSPESATRVAVIPFHAYPETWTPAGVTVENYLGAGFGDGFVRAADAACGAKPIWINETGFATVDGKTERDQAEWWARAVATFAAEPRIEHVGVYEIKDLKPGSATIGGTPNYHLGIARVDRTPKLAFHTIARLVKLIGGTTFEIGDRSLELSPASPDLHGHAFVRGDGGQVLVVWTTQTAATVRITLPKTVSNGSSIVEYAIDGTAGAAHALSGDVLDRLELRQGEVRIFEVKR